MDQLELQVEAVEDGISAIINAKRYSRNERLAVLARLYGALEYGRITLSATNGPRLPEPAGSYPGQSSHGARKD